MSRDIYYEKWGFMLIFWNLAGVPLSYCHCALYLANHLDTITDWKYPAARTPLLVLLFASYLFVYWIWDLAGSQKRRLQHAMRSPRFLSSTKLDVDRFRAQQRNEPIIRKTFPQLPYATLVNPKYLTTPSGDTIIISGVYAWARKIHYTCDIYFAITWGLICGIESPFPWFYPVFFTIMIVHRAWRDITRCRIKYGKTWEEYEKITPWLFIPVSCSIWVMGRSGAEFHSTSFNCLHPL